MYVGLWICILLLAFACREIHLATQYLSSIASSASDINRQMIAFMNGAYTDGRGGSLEEAAKGDLSLHLKHLEWWGYLGRRFYSNQATLFAQNEQLEKKAAAKSDEEFFGGN